MTGEEFSSCESSQRFAESQTPIIKYDVQNQVLWAMIICFFHRFITETCYLWLTWYYFSYRRNAQKLSRLFRDRPQTPLETAVFWTEYVIRHGGAPHMRSAELDLTWYQYLLLDVIAVIVLSTAIVLGTMYAVFKRFISTSTGRMLKKLKLNWGKNVLLQELLVENSISFPFGWLYFEREQVAIIILRIELGLSDCEGKV